MAGGGAVVTGGVAAGPLAGETVLSGTGAGELAGAGGAVHLPASQIRSPLQSVSLVHCARAKALAKNTAAVADNR